MAFKVKITYPNKEVGREPFRFDVYRSENKKKSLAKYGTLEIRKGSIRWFLHGEKEPIEWKWTTLNMEMKKSLKK